MPNVFSEEIKINFRHHDMQIKYSESTLEGKFKNTSIKIMRQECNKLIIDEALKKLEHIKQKVISHMFDSQEKINNILIITNNNKYLVTPHSKLGEEIILLNVYFEKINIQSEVSCK